MSSDYTLRPAMPSDTEAMLVVHVGAIIEHGPSAYSDKQVAAWAAKAEGTRRYANAIEDSDTELVVAATDDQIVGFGELDLDQGQIDAIFVDPEFNGNGIGSSILHQFERRFREEGFDMARLRAVLNAVGFYKRHGYDTVERVTTTTTGDVEMASIWMENPL